MRSSPASDRFLDRKYLALKARASRLLELTPRRVGLRPQDLPYAPSRLHFAAANHVDHIIIGARGGSFVRSLLGTVSAKIAAEAPCTVTVVRPRAPAVGATPEEGNKETGAATN